MAWTYCTPIYIIIFFYLTVLWAYVCRCQNRYTYINMWHNYDIFLFYILIHIDRKNYYILTPAYQSWASLRSFWFSGNIMSWLHLKRERKKNLIYSRLQWDNIRIGIWTNKVYCVIDHAATSLKYPQGARFFFMIFKIYFRRNEECKTN